jgi:hypothetical protein
VARLCEFYSAPWNFRGAVLKLYFSDKCCCILPRERGHIITRTDIMIFHILMDTRTRRVAALVAHSIDGDGTRQPRIKPHVAIAFVERRPHMLYVLI